MIRRFLAAFALLVALVAGTLAPASPAAADWVHCRSEGWCMWLYPDWHGPGNNGWQWDAAWIAARPGGILKFGSNQWNNYTAGWMLNSNVFQARLYLDANCTGTRYLYLGTDASNTNLKFASPESGGLNRDFYRSASCVRVFQV